MQDQLAVRCQVCEACDGDCDALRSFADQRATLASDACGSALRADFRAEIVALTTDRGAPSEASARRHHEAKAFARCWHVCFEACSDLSMC